MVDAIRQEYVILLSEQDQPCGTLERYATHTTTTPLRSAFSCWIFSEQSQLLITHRSLRKKVWPGVRINFVCGHPQLDKTYGAAIVRRARFELGADINLLSPVYDNFHYRAADPGRTVGNKVCPVYAAHIMSPPQLNPDEVMDCQRSSLGDVLSGIDATPWAFSLWMVMQVADKEARALLRNYCQQVIA